MRVKGWMAVPLVALTAVVAGGATLAPRSAISRTVESRAATQVARGMRFLGIVKANADPSYYPRAERSFRRALSLDPNNFTALFGMSTSALGRHDFLGGIEWARRAIAADPYNSDVYGALGDGLLEQGRYRAAERAFQRMIDLRPGLPSFARISYLRELHGDIEGAIAAMRSAYRSAGTADDAAWAKFHVANLYLNSGRGERARAIYRSAARLAPQTAGPLHGLAKAAEADGDLDRAARLMERVIELSREPGYAIYLGDLRAALGRRSAARAAYRLAGELEDREQAYGVNVNLEASLFAGARGRETEALRIAAAEHRVRNSLHVADAHAWALHLNGRHRAALRKAEEAARLGTRNPLFLFHRGMIERALGLDRSALEHLTAALRLNPTFSTLEAPIARKAIEELEATG